jgi:hypothetical protein
MTFDYALPAGQPAIKLPPAKSLYQSRDQERVYDTLRLVDNFLHSIFTGQRPRSAPFRFSRARGSCAVGGGDFFVRNCFQIAIARWRRGNTQLQGSDDSYPGEKTAVDTRRIPLPPSIFGHSLSSGGDQRQGYRLQLTRPSNL